MTLPRVRASYGDNYTRLCELKSVYDPTNLFRLKCQHSADVALASHTPTTSRADLAKLQRD